MSTAQTQVREFHRIYSQPVADEPTTIPRDRWLLRFDLIQEELIEYLDAAEAGDLTEIADAIGDLLYVVYGTAVEHGIDMGPIVDEIHRSNLSKLGEDGEPIYSPAGKVLKGPNYAPPNIAAVLEGLVAA